MLNLKHIGYLIWKDALLEWRNKSNLNSLVLYSVSTLFIIYLSLRQRNISGNPIIWHIFLWIIVLFTATQSIARSFLNERPGRQLFYYMIASPVNILLAKIIYNSVLLSILNLITFVLYSLIFQNPVQDLTLYILSFILGSISMSNILTLVSSIAAKTDNGMTLTVVLGFPLLIPVYLMLTKLSKNALDGLDRSTSVDELLILLSINLISLTLSLILFPYVWRS
jgi:heme exporter protein B